VELVIVSLEGAINRDSGVFCEYLVKANYYSCLGSAKSNMYYAEQNKNCNLFQL